jgi:hypothetical protein
METKIKIMATIVVILLIPVSCNQMRMSEQDPSAGFNGSFEKTKHGLPLNWYIYAPASYQKDYYLVFDENNKKHGKHSLRFDVKKVIATKQHGANPGMFGSIEADTGDKFKVSFWIKNKGCKFLIKMVCEGPGMPSEKIIRSYEDIDEWKYFEYEYTVPEIIKNVRFELILSSPGTFWIDDVRMEKTDK